MERVVLPAIMPTSYEDLVRVAAFFDTQVSSVHIDVMDGVFVPATSWPYTEEHRAQSIGRSVVQLPKTEELAYEVHLMVQDPYDIGSAFIAAGAKRIIAHIESFINESDARSCFTKWKHMGAEVGVSLLLETSLEVVYPLIEHRDVSVVQIMSISPIGVQGSTFNKQATERIRVLHEQYPHITIAVDGGVSKDTIPNLVHAGATHFGVGSAIVQSTNPVAAYQEICDTLQ